MNATMKTMISQALAEFAIDEDAETTHHFEKVLSTLDPLEWQEIARDMARDLRQQWEDSHA